MQQNRDLSFDAFRGLAIIAVVATHAIYLGGSWDSRGFLYYRQLLNFCVPAFFFISGYWASKEPLDSPAHYKAFLGKRLSRILVPSLFWLLLVWGYWAVKAGDTDGCRPAFLMSTYYFIAALAQLYILTGVLQYLNNRLGGYGLMLVVVFNLACLLALYLSRLLGVIGHVPGALPFYSWIFYYAMGLFCKERYERAAAWQAIRHFRPFILFAILASLLVSEVEVTIILSKYDNAAFAAFPTKFSTVLYSVCVILGFLFYKEYFGRLPRLLGTMGRYSFGIYLIHLIVLGRVVDIFDAFGVTGLFQPLRQLVLVGATLSICLVLIGGARRFFPERFCSKVLGF